MDRYDEYFDAQVGGGFRSGVGRIYVGAPYQRGHGGIGNFLAGVFRRVLPLLSRGAKAVGREALRTGVNVISDVANRNTPFAEALKTRARESGEVLKRKAEEKIEKLMEGSGYIDGHSLGVLQSLNGPETSKSKKRRRSTSRKPNKHAKKRKLGVLKKKKKKKKKVANKKKKKTRVKKKSKKRTLRDIFDR